MDVLTWRLFRCVFMIIGILNSLTLIFAWFMELCLQIWFGYNYLSYWELPLMWRSWGILSALKNLCGGFCLLCQKHVWDFVHTVKNSMGDFVRGEFCPAPLWYTHKWFFFPLSFADFCGREKFICKNRIRWIEFREYHIRLRDKLI